MEFLTLPLVRSYTTYYLHKSVAPSFFSKGNRKDVSPTEKNQEEGDLLFNLNLFLAIH